MLTVDQRRGIEDADGSRAHREQDQQALVTGGTQGSPDAAQHQVEPQHQADEQRDLPDTADFHELVALVTEPPVQARRHPALHRNELAGKRADHHGNQCPEQHVHAQLLELRILPTVDDRYQEEASSQEARGNPEDGSLDVPGTGEAVRQPVSQRNAIELLALHRVVRRGATQQGLHQEERSHHQQVLAQRLLRRRQLDQRQRVGGRRLHLDVLLVGEERPHPDDEAHAEDQHHHRGNRPDDVFRRRFVADQRLVRPVVGVGDIRARTVGAGSPGGPEVEGVHLATRFRVGQRVFLHGVLLAQRVHRRIVAEQLVVVRGHGLDGTDAVVRQRDLAVFRVVGIGAERDLRVVVQRGLVTLGQLGIGLAELTLCLLVQPAQHLAVDPVGRPVRRLICTVAPDRTHRHAADALPGRLAGVDIGLGIDDLAMLVHERGRDGRTFVVNLLPEIPEQRKRTDHDDRQDHPESFVLFHKKNVLNGRQPCAVCPNCCRGARQQA